MSDEYWPAPDWKFVGTPTMDCKHLWKQEPRDSYENWALVVTDGEYTDYFSFRQCVVCNSKQIKEPES